MVVIAAAMLVLGGCGGNKETAPDSEVQSESTQPEPEAAEQETAGDEAAEAFAKAQGVNVVNE